MMTTTMTLTPQMAGLMEKVARASAATAGQVSRLSEWIAGSDSESDLAMALAEAQHAGAHLKAEQEELDWATSSVRRCRTMRKLQQGVKRARRAYHDALREVSLQCDLVIRAQRAA